MVESLFDLDMPSVLASCRVHALRHVHAYRSFGTRAKYPHAGLSAMTHCVHVLSTCMCSGFVREALLTLINDVNTTAG